MSISTEQKAAVRSAAGSTVRSASHNDLKGQQAGFPKRFSPKNLLFLTDFSSASEAALPYATALASLYGSKLHVAHAVPPESLPPLLSQDLDAGFDVAWRQALEQLRDISIRAPDIPPQILLRQGEVGRVFSDMVESNDIDLIVLGTRGGSGFWITLLNSIAEQVYRRAPISALIVGPQVARKEANEVEFQHVLCAADFTPEADNALAYALFLAQEQGSDTNVVHVLKNAWCVSPAGQAEVRSALEKRLRELGLTAGQRWRPEFVVECGNPAERIVAAAAEKRADLLVLGVRRRDGSAASCDPPPETTACQVVSQAHCPVLCVVSMAA